ncbi:MAG: DUF262 domain-containing protein [Oscillospiraceae bacterium]|nr:DUF262 domain-containing protein [Oscillospiraceae bacterium]
MGNSNEKYSVQQYTVNNILNFIEADEIAIPEIQRPFVWKPLQVRNLIDSLYKGYPTGYLILWQNHKVKLKDGKEALGKKILIDGQQRVTAMLTSILGREIIDEDYKRRVFRIAFNPVTDNEDERFEVQNSSIKRSKVWVQDISEVFKSGFSELRFAREYLEKNPDVAEETIEKAISQLRSIRTRPMGVITLDANLDISEVTDIFVRVNSTGKRLEQSDFAMSKIATNERFGGNLLRKAIDYFCHLSVEPSFYSRLEQIDPEFMQSEYAAKFKWIKDDKDNLYNPGYDDMLRVAFMHRFGRGKLADLVSLLSGRDFETRTFVEEIAEESFSKLKYGVLDFMNEYHFKQFVLALKSAGFIMPKLINSMMTLDFAYTLYLQLHDGSVPKQEIKRYVQKWFVLSTLTSRYINSPESQFDRDLRSIANKGFISFLKGVEAAELADDFWDVRLVQLMETSAAASPYHNVYIAAQICGMDKSLLSSNIHVRDLLLEGDVHHIFPKEYLKMNGVNSQTQYNQIANYVYLDTSINIAIGKMAPSEYLKLALEQTRGAGPTIGTLQTEESFWISLDTNCIPRGIVEMPASDYSDFLHERRVLMARKIKVYYFSL